MTDFLSWWADHWPLIPFLAPVVLAGLLYLWERWVDRQFWKFMTSTSLGKWRREP